MNLNKKIFSLIIGLFLYNVSHPIAQDINAAANIGGVYLNAHDYAEGKLSFIFNCNSSGKIRLNDFLSSKYIDVVIEGKRTRLNKDSIFGYRNFKNETYRVYKKHDEEFRILENKGVVLYFSYIRVSSNNGKISQLVQAYFFSKTYSSEILPLTITNLKRIFPDNIKFHNLLDMEFGSGEPLSAYSTGDNMYKVNYLLNKSKCK